jgi:regulator of replication initiation timing
MSIITDILKEVPLSAILRERLTDAEAKMAALENENTSLKTENAILKTENQNLHVDLKKAHEEIERLKKPKQVTPVGGPMPNIRT